MSVPTAPVRQSRQTRKILLNLKCLFWCLHQLQTRYDLNLVLQSLERRAIHPEIADSNLGDNLTYLLDHLAPEDLPRLAEAIDGLPLSAGSTDIMDKHFEIGHYIQSLTDFGPIRSGTYGIISAVTPQLRGLFLVEGDSLIEAPFPPESTQTIFGTYVI